MKKILTAAMTILMCTVVCAPVAVPLNISITAEAAISKPSAPTSLKATVSGNTAKLTWDKVSGAEGYRVYIYNFTAKKYKKYKDVKRTSCEINSLTEGKNYLFKVAALKDGTVGTKSNKVKVTSISYKKKTKYGSITIEQLRWDTDCSKLSNAVHCNISVGDFLSDLDGDGVKEVINFTHTDKTDSKSYEEYGTYPVKPYINGKAVEFVSDEYQLFDLGAKYPVLRSGWFYVCDIDSRDKYKEIAIVPAQINDGCTTQFFRYIDGKLEHIGGIMYDAPSEDEPGLDFCEHYSAFLCNNEPMIIDGSGVIKATRRLVSQTWFAYTYYEIDPQSDKISSMPNIPHYPYGYEFKDDFWGASAKLESMTNWWIYGEKTEHCELRQDITVYAKPSFSSKSYTMKAQYALPTGEITLVTGNDSSDDYQGYLNNTWIYITAEDGTSGWIYLGDDENGNPVNDVHEIFSSLLGGW